MVLNKKQTVAVILFLVIASNVYPQSGTYLKNLWGKSVGEIVVVKDDATVLDSVLFDQYNRHIYNIVQTMKQFGYDATSFASLAAAIDTAAADTAMVIVASRQSIAETAPDTLPKTASLFVRQGGRIKITRKFRIEGHFIDPGPIQVFEGNLDSLEFAPGSVDYVRPEWFGSSSSASVQYAVNSIVGKGNILLGGWDYDINSTIRVYNDSLSIIGNKFNTLFNRTVDDTVFALYGIDKSNRIEQIVISGIRFDGTSSFTSPYIYASYFGKSVIRDFNFEDVTGPAVRIVQPWDILIANGRFDRCGSDGDSTKAGLTITSGTGDNANNVRIIDVTFENGRGGHLSILGENGGGLDHGFYIIQSKFHGWGDATSRSAYNPTSPFIYADSLENLSISQCRFAWSPASGPIVKIVKASNVSFFQNDFAAIVNHPAFEISNSIGVNFVANSFNSSGQTESDSLFGSVLDSNTMVMMLGNVFIGSGENFSEWNVSNEARFTFTDTSDFKVIKFTRIDSSSAKDYLYVQPKDLNYKSIRIRSDGRVLFREGESGVQAAIYATPSGLLVSQNGFITMGNAYVGTSLQTDSLRVSAITNTNTPSGATAYALPIYNKSGNLIGYVPVYATQW